MNRMSQMTPREIVQELDNHIIGQDEAKRAVAIALRNRWRRVQIDEPLRSEITPKNILMIGPTGVGKTEIAKVLAEMLGRRLIRLQCYEGLDIASAVYEWNYSLQMIDIRIAEATAPSVVHRMSCQSVRMMELSTASTRRRA